MVSNLRGKELQRYISIKRNQIFENIKTARTRYINEWVIDETAYSSAEHYKWMATFVSGYARILEIGVGSGCGTLALAGEGHTVIGIDENPVCIERASTRLTDKGYKVKTILRGEVHPVAGEDYYDLKYKNIRHQMTDEQILLVEGCIPYDSRLYQWLLSLQPFDAVVCWLIGSHQARHADRNVIRQNIQTPHEYRLSVQNPTFELASRVLRSGGILNIIDRGKPDNSSLFLQCRREQASPTGLLVDERTDVRQFDKVQGGAGMCQMYDGVNIQPVIDEKMFFLSTVCKMP